ncbi:MAG TPA: LysE family translocator [Streptosporangiaceae bacterium]|jgi:threonine/homoserine/homoserine lactone efflux protein
MTWSSYGVYLAVAVLVVIAPGPDFALTVKNALVGGSRGGLGTALGIATSNVAQGSAAALGLGALIMRSQPLFEAIRWAGVCYLLYLGVQALRAAVRGAYSPAPEAAGARVRGLRAYRQGFLSNITNPKVLTLYLSVLPSFLGRSGSVADGLLLAYTHALLSLAWLTLIVVFLGRLRPWLVRRTIRRALDAIVGCALIGFGVRLAFASK